ncbi:Gfo/Idh/MocA family protein [Propionibacteriaceae bacterium Y2011]
MADRYRVTAVADPVPERRAEAVDLLGTDAYDSAESVIDHAEVDVVVVASPSHTHTRLGLAALAAGKHVVLEKPMAATVAEVDQLVEAARTAGRVVTCFHNNRFEGSLLTIRTSIEDGRIGEPLLIRRCVHRYARRRDWQTLTRFGGGELANQVSHYLDQLLSLYPDSEVELLAADLRHTISAGDAEDHAKVVLRAADGPLLEIEGSGSMAIPQPHWFVAGTAGAITGSMSELTVRWVDPTALPPISVDTGPAADRQYGTGETIPWQEETITVDRRDRTEAFYDNLAEAINGRAEPAITPASVRRQIQLLGQARALAATPTTVTAR